MHKPRDITKDKNTGKIILHALKEDIGRKGDITSLALIPDRLNARAVIISRNKYVISGANVAASVFKQVDPKLKCSICIPDGKTAEPNQVVMRINGNTRSILLAERTALNFLQRMTGIASLTKRFVDKVKPHGVTILDTRKTTPGLRALEKYAVLCGGGQNHRMGLYDRILIKDNHREIFCHKHKQTLDKAIREARKRFPGVEIEVEVEDESQLKQALTANPDWILLDNMTPKQMACCAKLCGGKCKLEASGGIGLKNVEKIARTGIDAISLGCLTHSAPAADLSLEIC